MSDRNNSKAIVIVSILILLICIAIIAVVVFVKSFAPEYNDKYDYSPSDRYTQYIVTHLEQGEEIRLADVFEFEFSEAYVIEDSYVTGQSIKQSRHLNLDLDSIGSVGTDGIRRIAFFNNEGRLIFEYRYSAGDLFPVREGFMVYPSTVLSRRNNPTQYDSIRFDFVGIREIP
jgi:hypothetical protein